MERPCAQDKYPSAVLAREVALEPLPKAVAQWLSASAFGSQAGSVSRKGFAVLSHGSGEPRPGHGKHGLKQWSDTGSARSSNA